MKLCITIKNAILSITALGVQYCDAELHYAEWHYAECRYVECRNAIFEYHSWHCEITYFTG